MGWKTYYYILKNTPPEYSDENFDEIIKTKKEEVKSEIWNIFVNLWSYLNKKHLTK